MDISDLINDFLESLEIEKGRSTKTTENYGLYLARFFELIAQDFPEGATIKPSDLTPELLRKFRLRLNRFDDNQNHERLSALTQSYHLIALRGFLKYLAKRGIHSLDPSLVDLPRAAKKQVTFLHFDEVERLLSEIPIDTETGLRDRAIIELLFSGGLRVSELCSLNRDSINLTRREFMVRGKGKKDRPTLTPETTLSPPSSSIIPQIKTFRILPEIFAGLVLAQLSVSFKNMLVSLVLPNMSPLTLSVIVSPLTSL